MSRSPNRNSRAAKKRQPGRLPGRQSVEAENRAPATRSIVKDILLGLLICLGFFVLLEAGLRAAGVGSKDPGDDPFVGFSAIKPLYVVKNGVASTAPSRLPYFNDMSFSAVKPHDTLRIFAFGGSTTYGHPFDWRTSFPRWLENLVNATDPDRKCEAINAGGISYASYRIAPLIREALRYQPDLVIVFTGHNEHLERRTYSSLFDQGGILVTMRSVVEDLHTYQALKRVMEMVLPGLRQQSEQVSPGSLGASSEGREKRSPESKPLLHEEVTAILDRSAGLDLYHRDEQFSHAVIDHFAHNLKAMITLCKQAGVPIFLVHPVSNIRDFSPFKSEHAGSLNAKQCASLDAELEKGARLVRDGRNDEALRALEDVERQDPLFAEAHFWKAKALLAMGRADEAKRDFVRAKDLDVCPLRATTPIEDKIAQVARSEKVPLIPFKEAVERRARETGDPSGSPGNESFLDHVHPTIERHQMLAEQILSEMIAHRLVSEKIQLTREQRQALYDSGMKSLDRQFFATKDLNLAKTLRWAGKKREAREALQRAGEILVGNPEVHKMMGSFLLEEGEPQEAVKEYERAVELSGNDPRMEYSLAIAYYRAGHKDDAKRLYEKLLRNDPGNADACADLATILLEKGNVEEALKILRKGLDINSDSQLLFAPYALALAMSGKAADAIPWMLRAVRAEPGNPRHFYNLAGMYAVVGKSADALRALNEAVSKGYNRSDSLLADPVFSSIRNLPEFSRILSRIE